MNKYLISLSGQETAISLYSTTLNNSKLANRGTEKW